MIRVDAHQHYWNPARGDYGWMPEDDPVLARPYGPGDLAPELGAHGIDRTILVQAAPTIEETEYLLGIADATPHVAAVVGWIDFENPDARHLQRLAKHPKFAGVRPMIQDIPDDGWMLREDVQWAFRALADLGLTFDALGFPRHLDPFLTILQRYPDLRSRLGPTAWRASPAKPAPSASCRASSRKPGRTGPSMTFGHTRRMSSRSSGRSG